MPTEYVQRGESIDYIPAADVAAGDVIVQGELVGVAKKDIKADTLGALAVEGVFDTITRTLSKGDEVRLVGFGTFSVARRKASTGRNPRTGEPMTIKASTQPKFKAGKGLKDAVN